MVSSKATTVKEYLGGLPEDRRDVVSAVRRTIRENLPPGYREAILLHDVEGYTHEEVAALTGVDAGTSKSQLSRARRALRARLSGRSS